MKLSICTHWRIQRWKPNAGFSCPKAKPIILELLRKRSSTTKTARVSHVHRHTNSLKRPLKSSFYSPILEQTAARRNALNASCARILPIWLPWQRCLIVAYGVELGPQEEQLPYRNSNSHHSPDDWSSCPTASLLTADRLSAYKHMWNSFLKTCQPLQCHKVGMRLKYSIGNLD